MLNLLNQLTNEPSTNNKLKILKENQNNELLKLVFERALNPLISYYVRQIPDYDHNSNNLTLEEAINQLNDLSSRKITGNLAISHLSNILSNCTNDDAEVIKRIVKRDLRCGVNRALVSKIWKDLLPAFPYMRMSLPKQIKLDKIDWTEGAYSQLKEDATFANVNFYQDRSVQIYSRNGTEYPLDKFQNIITNLNDFMPGFQYHGEMMVLRDDKLLPREISNGIINHVLSGGDFAENEKPAYRVWDMVDLNILKPKCTWNTPYKHRYSIIVELYEKSKLDDIQPVETKIVYSMSEAMEHYREMIQRGLEGTIVKFPNAVWKDGTSKEMFKLKLDIDVDLVVTGFIDGNGKNANTFGSITCETSDGNLSVNVSGLTDEKRQWIHENRDNLIGKIITVKSNNLMKPTYNGKYSLFLPRFVEFRNDKDIADTIEQVIDQFESAIK